MYCFNVVLCSTEVYKHSLCCSVLKVSLKVQPLSSCIPKEAVLMGTLDKAEVLQDDLSTRSGLEQVQGNGNDPDGLCVKK